MRIKLRAIRQNKGCSSNTARATPTSCAINTTTALTRPAITQAAAMRLKSSKPKKRHRPRGTPVTAIANR